MSLYRQYKDKSRVSIVLPVHNGEKFLAYSIESILNQTYRNIELIIVNDCSKDSTPEIIKEYSVLDPRIKIITNPQNLKLPRSLNVGFENASGDFFTWTSDDNIYKPDAIEKMLAIMEQMPDIDMVYANFTIIDVEGKELREVQTGSHGGIYENNTVGACFMYTRRIAEKIGGYDPDFFLAEDYEYWIRIFENGSAFHLNENLYYYRVHKNSLSASAGVLVRDVVYRIYKRHFMFLFSNAPGFYGKLRFLVYMEDCAKDANHDVKALRSVLYSKKPGYRIARSLYLLLRSTKRAIKRAVKIFIFGKGEKTDALK